MIDLIAAAGIGGIIGFGTCAVLTMGKVADNAGIEETIAARDWWQNAHTEEFLFWTGAAALWDAERKELTAEHDRCADALETARNRIERALEQITPGANATVQRIARILRGDA